MFKLLSILNMLNTLVCLVFPIRFVEYSSLSRESSALYVGVWWFETKKRTDVNIAGWKMDSD